MIRSSTRLEPKKRRIDHKKTQFAQAGYKENEYSQRLSLYDIPPTAEVSLEEFETWAIDRLKGKRPGKVLSVRSNISSPGRAGDMLLSQQITGRDSDTH